MERSAVSNDGLWYPGSVMRGDYVDGNFVLAVGYVDSDQVAVIFSDGSAKLYDSNVRIRIENTEV